MYSIVLMSVMAGPATPPAAYYSAVPCDAQARRVYAAPPVTTTQVVTVRTTATAYGAGCSGSFAASSAGCSGNGVEGRRGLFSGFRNGDRERRFKLFGRASRGCGG